MSQGLRRGSSGCRIQRLFFWRPLPLSQADLLVNSIIGIKDENLKMKGAKGTVRRPCSGPLGVRTARDASQLLWSMPTGGNGMFLAGNRLPLQPRHLIDDML